MPENQNWCNDCRYLITILSSASELRNRLEFLGLIQGQQSFIDLQNGKRFWDSLGKYDEQIFRLTSNDQSESDPEVDLNFDQGSIGVESAASLDSFGQKKKSTRLNFDSQRSLVKLSSGDGKSSGSIDPLTEIDALLPFGDGSGKFGGSSAAGHWHEDREQFLKLKCQDERCLYSIELKAGKKDFTVISSGRAVKETIDASDSQTFVYNSNGTESKIELVFEILDVVQPMNLTIPDKPMNTTDTGLPDQLTNSTGTSFEAVIDDSPMADL
jgi:hypothetical protein